MDRLYLITGDDLFEKQRELEKVKSYFPELIKGINYVCLDKDTIWQLQSEVNTFPFGYDSKLIVVNLSSKQSQDDAAAKNEWFTDALMTDIVNSLNTNYIVFVGDFQQRSKVYKFVSQNGKCIDCDKPKNKKDISPWVIKIVKEGGKNISMESANYIVNVCGSDKLMLYNEIQKLIDYIGDRNEITKSDIEKVGIRTLETIIFDLTDSLGMRRAAEAIRFLNELLLQKEPIQKILIMIARHFKSLLITKICVAENRDVASELNTKFPFIIHKYKEQARSFSKEELENLIVSLANLDVDSKIGKMDAKIGLETILIGVMG